VWLYIHMNIDIDTAAGIARLTDAELARMLRTVPASAIGSARHIALTAERDGRELLEIRATLADFASAYPEGVESGATAERWDGLLDAEARLSKSLGF
jgi:hypothetical protein